jgi:hypothetical protein
MRPLSCITFLAIHCLGAAAYATAMSVDAPTQATDRGAAIPGSAPVAPREAAAEPASVRFEATAAAVDLWRPADGEAPLAAASQGLGVATEAETPSPACSDSSDNDGDGRTDFPDDPGCITPGSVTERPRCQDGIDTDADGHIDFDGGASLNGGAPLAPPDPQCIGAPWRDRERP